MSEELDEALRRNGDLILVAYIRSLREQLEAAKKENAALHTWSEGYEIRAKKAEQALEAAKKVIFSADALCAKLGTKAHPAQSWYSEELGDLDCALSDLLARGWQGVRVYGKGVGAFGSTEVNRGCPHSEALEAERKAREEESKGLDAAFENQASVIKMWTDRAEAAEKSLSEAREREANYHRLFEKMDRASESEFDEDHILDKIRGWIAAGLRLKAALTPAPPEPKEKA